MNGSSSEYIKGTPLKIFLTVLIIVLAIFLVQKRWLVPRQAPAAWQWITCDVGQGDAHLIRTGQDSAYLLDTGTSYPALHDCLVWAGVRHLDAVIVTHAHSDHDGALPEVQQEFSQPPVILSPHYSRPGASYPMSQKLAAGSVISQSPAVDTGEVQHPMGQVLWPPEHAQRIPGTTGSSSWINNSSLVIRWILPPQDSSQRHITVLSTGDIEADAAHRLLAEAAGQVPADVLKIAHHGSDGSGTDLITAAQPSLALISVGEGNSYGHPHQGILDVLHSRSIPTARTDAAGHLALTTTDQGILLTSSG